MMDEATIRNHLTDVLEETNASGVGEREKGKVRDSYRRDGVRVLVTTDRISAFDVVLGTVPFKGQVLNQLAEFWFEKTMDIVPNHVLSVPDPNVMLVRECEQIPLEFVVRGYITGVTKTSAWYNYEQGVRNFCGNILPEGLQKNQKLPAPILTPTTKLEKHDRPISREEAIEEGLITPEAFDEAADICFRLFERGVKHAASRGLILVDTKYEIGRIDGEFVLSDEVHTPDSSRYWFSETYEKRFNAGEKPEKLDKEYVREWLADRGYRGDGAPPELPDDVRIEAARRYIRAYELVTGRDFRVPEGPVRERVESALNAIAKKS